MKLWVWSSPEVQMVVGTSFVSEAGLDMVSEKGQSREGVFK